LYWEEVGNEVTNNSAGPVHVTAANQIINFGAPGMYRIGIDPVSVPLGTNNFSSFNVDASGDKGKLRNVTQWGAAVWTKLSFYGAENFSGFTSTDTPDLSVVQNLNRMFRDTPALVDVNGIGSWDLSTVESLTEMFFNSPLVNPDTSGWDLSSVTSLAYLFGDTNMRGVFSGSIAANPNTSSWDTSSVNDMKDLFAFTSSANPDTSGWDTSSVVNMNGLFRSAAVASPDVSAWDTSSVTDMGRLFSNAPSAVPDVSNWDTSSAITFADMFLAHGIRPQSFT